MCVHVSVCAREFAIKWRLVQDVPAVSWDGVMDEFTQTDKQETNKVVVKITRQQTAAWFTAQRKCLLSSHVAVFAAAD